MISMELHAPIRFDLPLKRSKETFQYQKTPIVRKIYERKKPKNRGRLLMLKHGKSRQKMALNGNERKKREKCFSPFSTAIFVEKSVDFSMNPRFE